MVVIAVVVAHTLRFCLFVLRKFNGRKTVTISQKSRGVKEAGKCDSCNQGLPYSKKQASVLNHWVRKLHILTDHASLSVSAVGLLLNCSTHAIQVTVPKTALRDLQGDFLSLLDPTCKVTETPTHYIFDTALDKCGTKRRSTPNFIVYSNRIMEKKASAGSIITRVGENEFDIPICCYYLNNGITSAVGIKPEVKQLYLNENG